MKYELILQGNKTLIIDQLTANKIQQAVNAKAELIEVQGIRFKYSMFKGMFPIKDEVRDDKEERDRANREWNTTCLVMSKRTADEKTDREIKSRILPGLKLNNIHLLDDRIATMEANIRNFFEENPKYPRCPMKIWWPFIADVMAPMNPKTKKRQSFFLRTNKWWDYVSRNDDAIANWIFYQ